MKCLLRWLFVAVLFISGGVLSAEKVSDLPAPTGYVNDFAHVLSPATIRSLDNLCLAVDRQAHAQIAVVTIHKLEDDQSIEEFATELEDKWKVGAKATDRGVLMVLVMNPTRGRIEVGYGLEGILNDAKVGDIGREMAPYAQKGDYDEAIPLGVQEIARIIADDAGVTLSPVQRTPYRTTQQQSVHISLLQILILGGIGLFLIILLVATGNTGILWFLLGMFMSGGGGGGGGYGGGNDRDDDGGGFGGFGGGSSGGGGASGNF